MGGDNPLITILTLFFGVLVGMMGIASMLYFGGFTVLDRQPLPVGVSQPKSGMELFEQYGCLRSERKVIVLGGREDNFSTIGTERPNTLRFDQSAAGQNRTRLPNRLYDEGGTDKILRDEFSIPSKTAHGRFVMKIRALSDLKNDGFSIGDLFGSSERSKSYNVQLEGLESQPDWQSFGELYWIDIADLGFQNDGQSTGQANLLKFIQSGSGSTNVGITIGDDTQVDFAGMVACMAPDIRKGTRFQAAVFDLPEGFANLSCSSPTDGFECDLYRGDITCENSRPLACFKESLTPLPDGLVDHVQKSAWSGGEIRLTDPIAGTRFQTADAAHKFCQESFGQSWRMLSFSDGNTSSRIVGTGNIPAGQQAWIDVPSQPYATCWAQRTGYNELEN